MHNFCQALDTGGFTSLEYVGYSFTWYNHHFDDENVKAWLDWAVTTNAW